jgi:formylglycine-generating enzyme required for sulfatase activity
MKTIIAPPPEPAFAGQPSPSVPEVRPAPTRALLVIVAVLGICALIAVGIVWRVYRGKSTETSSASTPPIEKTNSGAAITGATFNEAANGADIALVSIPAGSFLMGSPTSDPARDQDEGPQTNVTLQKFYLSKFEITQAQYRAIVGSNPSKFKGDDLPVDSVSWNEATEFCRRLSTISGRTYRLPTEAEWEYAARAGASSSSGSDVSAQGWCGANSDRHTHPVGQKQANTFGLYDMYGNVWEWCQSEYKPYPYQDNDGRESLNASAVHVLRGGSWSAATKGCRPTYRRRVVPEPSTSGFRIVLVT